MSDDTVGNPIYFIDNYADNEIVGKHVSDIMSLDPVISGLIMARFEALFEAVEASNADGFILGGSDGRSLSLFVSDGDGERIMDIPIPSDANDDIAAWIISSISGVGLRLNLVTDPALCQCFCGFAGEPKDWLNVLLPDFVSEF